MGSATRGQRAKKLANGIRRISGRKDVNLADAEGARGEVMALGGCGSQRRLVRIWCVIRKDRREEGATARRNRKPHERGPRMKGSCQKRRIGNVGEKSQGYKGTSG